MMGCLVAFGITNDFFSIIERLDVICKVDYFVDNNKKHWGQYICGDERVCIRPDQLKNLKNPLVIIMCERESSILAVEEQCEEYGVQHIRLAQYLQKLSLKSTQSNWPQNIQRKRIHKFIELLVHGTTECNFRCEYCYVWTTKDFTHEIETSKYTPQEFRRAMSLQRLGGPCHINACALGETLLSKDIVDLTYELLEEGHYISIITNGTVSQKIHQILDFPHDLLERMFFKLSFHYGELKRTKLLNRFWDNVEKIKNSPCSYSIEITPCDSLIPEIENIKNEFNEHANGAMPHITFTRDGNKIGLDLLSELTLDEYIRTWSVFDSELFNLKSSLYKKHICENCYAGNWSYRINVVNGNLQSCYGQKLNGTIFDHENQLFPIEEVGQHCQMDYCFNNHAFLAWGDAPDIQCSSYLSVRNRQNGNEENWIKESYAVAMNQKLYDNNFEYIDKWDDYKKLMNLERKPAFILFNSPDYSNLGDHAIALAEKRYIQRVYPTADFIEISCEQYIKENILIKNVIKPDDILLISGGGYLGSLWLWLEDLTKNIIQNYPNNKIIIFPQTMYFEQSSLGESERESLVNTCNIHKDITIILRDKKSYLEAEKIFNSSVCRMYIPDIVFSLKYNSKKKREFGMICFRDDKESCGSDIENTKAILQEKGMSVKNVSTIADHKVYLNQRELEINNLLENLSTARVVVTDRLHAMIMCVITQTPCVVFDNISGKISQTYEFIKDNGKVQLCSNVENLRECIEKVLNNQDDRNDSLDLINRKFDELDKYLKETCKL